MSGGGPGSGGPGGGGPGGGGPGGGGPSGGPGDEATQWKLHLADAPADGAEAIKIAGCTIPLPPKPTPSFWRAVEHGDTARLDALLSAGESVNQLGGAYGCSAVGWAALAGDDAMLALCLSRGADANLKAKKGSAPLHMAVWNFDNVSCVERLLVGGADPTLTNHHGQTALELAKWFDALESASSASDVFDLDGWRETWGHPKAGRAGVIALLEAAAASARAAGGGEESDKATGAAEPMEDDEEDDDDGDGKPAGGLRGVSADAEGGAAGGDEEASAAVDG
jgi:hypothetical protein